MWNCCHFGGDVQQFGGGGGGRDGTWKQRNGKSCLEMQVALIYDDYAAPVPFYAAITETQSNFSILSLRFFWQSCAIVVCYFTLRIQLFFFMKCFTIQWKVVLLTPACRYRKFLVILIMSALLFLQQGWERHLIIPIQFSWKKKYPCDVQIIMVIS